LGDQAKYKIVQDPAVSRAFYYGTLQYVWWHVKIDGPAFPAMYNVPSARQDLVHKAVKLRRNRPYAQATLCSPVHSVLRVSGSVVHGMFSIACYTLSASPC